MSLDDVNFSDYRRAVVVTIHHRRGDMPGVIAIVDETNELRRAPHLLMAVLGLHKQLIPRLRTSEGIELLGNYIQGMADLETTEAPGIDISRAAQIIDSHIQQESDGIAAVLNAATTDNRMTELFVQAMDLYEVALPELSSEQGLEWLQAFAAAYVTKENEPGDDQGGGTPA